MALKFRRGTTAQQSGSLAFGEPYVNTTLGTLVIGGATGDIVLSSTGTGSTGNFGAISGSGLDITGNANIAGNLTLGGAITIGDATADTVNVVASLSSSLIPQTTNAFDLGSASKIWRDLYISTGSIKFVAGTTVVKELNLATLTALETATGSANVSISNLNTTTASLSQRIAANETVSSSYARINSSNTFNNDQTFSGSISLTGRITAGLSVSASGLNINKADGNVQIELVNSTTGKGFHLQSYNGDAFSIHNPSTGLSTFRIDSGSTGYHSNFFGNVLVLSGSVSSSAGFSGSINGIGNVTAYSSSIATQLSTLGTLTGSNGVRLTNLETFSGSENIKNTTLGTYTGSVETRFTTLGTYTASVDTRFTTLGTLTGSNAIRLTNLESTTASLSQRVAANEAVSGTFARTNSANVFTGTQTITGSLYISQDLVVAGSSSIQNISSSNLVIGAAYVTLNTNTPSSRFAGINIIDSGSGGNSGSFLYDAVQDEFIQVHKGNGLNVTSSHFVQGPQTYDNLGNETYLTNNRLTKGTGLEHIVDSQITDDGSTVSIPGALTVTGNITGPIRANNGVVSGSSQITYASISSIPSGIVSGSSQVVGSSITTNTITIGSTSTALGGTSTTLAGLTSVSSTGFTGALTGNASTATTLATARTINGTSFNGSADITIQNLVSGSGQITLSGVAGYGSILNQAVLTTSDVTHNSIAGQIRANNGVVSGSSQITGLSNAQLTNSSVTVTAGTGMSGGGAVALGSSITLTNAGVTSAVAGTGVSVSGATGAVTISIGQAVATSSSPTFAGLTINGAITATGDITAYFSSDKRFKSNIQLIPNALEKVSKLNGVTWTWNEDVNEVTKTTPNTGLIAQEVQEVLPEVVMEREDGHLGLDYSKMVGLLVEAIKEQQIQIEELKAQIGSK
jgi:hypothetical protein